MVYCQKCGTENRDSAKFCRGCGITLKKEESKPKEVAPEVTTTGDTPSKAWYLAPVVFGLVGGAITYFVLKDRDKGMAKNCLWLGIAITAIFLIYNMGLFFIL